MANIKANDFFFLNQAAWERHSGSRKASRLLSGLMPFTASLIHLMTKTPVSVARHKVGPEVATTTWQSYASQLVEQNIVTIPFRCLTFQPKENKLIQGPKQVL